MTRRSVLLYSAGNLAALALVAYAANQPWVEGASSSPVPASLVRAWLPFALVIFAIVDLSVASTLPAESREGFVARHFALYLASPLTLLLLYFGEPAVLPAQAGAFLALLVAAFAANAIHGIWLSLEHVTDRRAALLLGAVALAAYLAIVPYHRAVQPTASDEPHYLIVMQSLADDRDLDLANDYAGDHYLRFYPSTLEDIHGIHVGPHIYSIRDLGLPLVGAVPFALGGRTGVLALISLAGAALAVQLYLLLRDLAFAPRLALLATAGTALLHPLLTYTTQVYPEILAALAFVTAARLMRHGSGATARDLALASAALGTLPWLTTRAWPTVVGAGVVLAWFALRNPRAASDAAEIRHGSPETPARLARVGAAALPFAALVLALSALNWLQFGLFMPAAGYFLIRDQQAVFGLAPQVGALGLLFDRVFGLVGRGPLYLLAFLGAANLVRRARDGHGAELVPLALGWGLSFLYIADIAYWWADGSPQPRYLIATMPFLVAGVAAGIETIASMSRARAFAAGLAWAAAAWGTLVTFAYTVIPTVGYDLAVDIRESGSSGRLFDYIGRVVRPDPGVFFPSLVRIDGASVALSVAWLAVAAALVLAGSRTTLSARAAPERALDVTGLRQSL